MHTETVNGMVFTAAKPKIWGKYPRKSWVLIMVIATALYLMVEFGFNSRLLDVVGGMPDAEAVDSIELYGRIISGFALALALWPMIMKEKCDRGEPVSASLPRVVLISAIAITAVYLGEKKLVDWVVDSSTAQMRYTATNLVAVQNVLVAKGVELEGLAFSPDQLSQPDGKTFLAIFPLLAMTTKDIDKKIQNVKAQILHIVVDQKRGGHTQSYNNFINSRKTMINHYNQDYLNGCEKYNHVINSIGTEQANAWADYKRRLASKRLSPDSVPPRYWGKVRRDVIYSGVAVPERWNPSDRNTFNRAIANKINKNAIDSFNKEIKKIFSGDEVIPPNLDKDKFFSHPAIQKYWREKLKYPDTGNLLPITLPNPDKAPYFYKEIIYTNVVNSDVKELLKKYNAPIDTFADGQPQEQLGKDGMRALAVPPIALMFSILGALIHVFKLSLFSIQLIFARGFHHGGVKMLFVVSLAILLLASFYPQKNSTITTQPLYQYFEQRGLLLGDGQKETTRGWLVVHFAKSTIHAQKVAYPIFEKVRNSVLFGYEFGFHQKTEG